MARYSPWKALERRTAKWMRGERLWRPDYGDSAPDGESETDVWDCKCYARFSVIALYQIAEKKYRQFAQGRRFSLVLYSREHPGAGDFVLMRAKDVEQLLEIERAWTAGGR